MVMKTIAILMGWPSLVSALLLASAGVWSGKPVLIWIGAILIVPIALYLSASPAYPLVGLIPVGALVAAALTCRRPATWQSLVGVGVYSLFLLVLAAIVIDQPIGS